MTAGEGTGRLTTSGNSESKCCVKKRGHLTDTRPLDDEILWFYFKMCGYSKNIQREKKNDGAFSQCKSDINTQTISNSQISINTFLEFFKIVILLN